MSSKKYNWDEIISNFQNSGLSQAEFSRQNQLNAKYLNQQLSKRNLLKPKSAFVKIPKKLSNQSESIFHVTIDCNQTMINLNNPDPKWLADFCKAFTK